ncbi:MAG: HAMP domain-containing histidine kinase [Hyphomonadaceae bacterium]|nr:HAMP domain-containing histidine kinase [Hyphomonadaceae bacterium]
MRYAKTQLIGPFLTVVNFQSPWTLSAARAHVGSLNWRLAVWGLFAIGASLDLASWQAGLAWFLTVSLAAGFDTMLGRSYLTARTRSERRTSGVLFACGCAFSSTVFVAMPVLLAAHGGGPGRVLAVLMASSAFVLVMVFMSRARGLMFIVGAPAVFALIAMPFIPYVEGPADPLAGALGVACGIFAFLTYVSRAALNQNMSLARLEVAHETAKERQREAEAKHAEAIEANRAKSEFLCVMTHELRTPLNAVIGYAELLQEELEAEGRKSLSTDASRIHGSARHLLGLIDQILHLTSVEAGQDSVTPSVVDVRRMLEEAVTSLQEDANVRQNRIALRVSPEAEQAFTDAAKVSVCAAALLSNAVKFTENGLIGVTAEREAGDPAWLRVTVSDTGRGIAASDIERVFTAFTQVDASSTRTSGGLGLGLSVARRIARRLGGDVTVVSELGVGSTFTLRVPLRHDASVLLRAVA